MMAGAVVTCLAVTIATSAVATSMDALGILLVALVAGAALAFALIRPELLLYLYCVAIPFNFALPPGPAGTVARIAGLVFFFGYLVRRPDALRPGIIPLVGWAFMGWALASCLWAIDGDAAFNAWVSLVQLFVISILIASIVAADTRVVRNALWAYALAATFTAGIGCVSYLQSPAAFLGRAAAFPDQDPALFASLVLPATIILMGEVQARSTRPALRVLALAALAVCAVALAISGTRSAWLGLVVAVGVWLVLQRGLRQVLAVTAVAASIGVLVVALPETQAFLLGRASTSLVTGGSGRTDIWSVGMSILASAPLSGVGLGNFPTAFTPYAISQATASAATGALYAGRAPHNVLLGTSVETGLVGGLLLVGFMAAALADSRGERGNVIRAALVSLFVQAMFLDILLQKQLWLFIALAFGLGAAWSMREAAAVSPRSWRSWRSRVAPAAGAFSNARVDERGSSFPARSS
jgi:exopolysaccharide production protein ExoQ